jgi:ParB family transcriptional regulator, chromosome partitioning protein
MQLWRVKFLKLMVSASRLSKYENVQSPISADSSRKFGKMTRKTGLGRGLDSLIPTQESSQPARGITHVPVGDISPNPRQPRANFDDLELEELAASIREHGIIQPLVLFEAEENGKYCLIAGERRWLAARKAGLDSVPALIRQATQQELLEIALVENVQRADLSPLEAAEAYRQLSEEFQISHEQIAIRVGKSRTSITNTLRLLKLPQSVQRALAARKISEGHARALLALTSVQAQTAALETILRHDLNVRQTEELVRKLSGEKPTSQPKPAPPPELVALEERLRSQLGTRVSLNHGPKGGTLVIHYYSDEELDNIVLRIMGEDS